MLGKVGRTPRAIRMALVTVAMATVALGVATLPAAADDGGPTECRGTMGADTVSAIDVPQNASCTLDGTTVTGDVVVGIDATLDTTDQTTILGSVNRPVDCTGTLGAVTIANVVVPDGATCTLTGSIVTGSIKVGAGSSLYTSGATIAGNVQATDGPLTVRLIDTNIGLNVHVEQAIRKVVIGSAGCTVDPTVGNDVILQGNFGAIALCYLSVGNDVILQGNAKSIGVFHNEVGNNIIAQNNTGNFVRLRYNHVGFTGGGGINFQDNTSQGLLLLNTVGNAINCTGNTPDPIGSGNIAGSGLNDQCAALG